jgi:arginyl-tRNA synthetase
VQRSDGAYLYAATDFAALYYRLHHLKVDEIYYVTDYSQKRHFAAITEVTIFFEIIIDQSLNINIK